MVATMGNPSQRLHTARKVSAHRCLLLAFDLAFDTKGVNHFLIGKQLGIADPRVRIGPITFEQEIRPATVLLLGR